MTKKLRPVHDLVLVRPLQEKESAGGIKLPDNLRETGFAHRGTVVAAGPGRIDRDGAVVPMSVKPEDTIVYTPFAGLPVKHDVEELRLMREGEVLAVEETTEVN